MDLTYPPEAEEFRGVISAWLEENLPEGWGTPEFSMTPEQRAAFNDEWTAKLLAGGWICASWPVDYGGKGLTLLQQVVLNEEFARVGAPLRGTSSATPWWDRRSCSGEPRSRRSNSSRASSRVRSRGAKDSASPTRVGPRQPQDQGGTRR